MAPVYISSVPVQFQYSNYNESADNKLSGNWLRVVTIKKIMKNYFPQRSSLYAADIVFNKTYCTYPIISTKSMSQTSWSNLTKFNLHVIQSFGYDSYF